MGFGPDASTLTSYAYRAGTKLGAIGLGFENTGANPVTLQVRELVGSGTAAVYSYNLGAQFVVNAGGYVEKNYVIVNQQFALFGSGNTTVNMTAFLRNLADRRDAQLDIVPVGKQNWGYSPGENVNAFSGNYGPTPLQ